MKRSNSLTLATLAASILILIAAPMVMADPVLRLSSGGTVILIEDGSALDLNPVTGVVLFSGAVNNWFVNVSTGITQPAQGSPMLPYMDLNSVNMSQGAGTIEISFTETDFTYLGAFEMQIGGTAANGGNVTYQLYQDPNNVLFSTTNLVGTIGPIGPGAFSSTIFGPGLTYDDPQGYSLTQSITINHSAGGTTSFDAVAAVPEPSALLLLGTGLAGLGIWRIRKK